MNAAMGILLGVFLSVPTPGEFKRAARVVLEDGQYQRDLPGAPTAHQAPTRSPREAPEPDRPAPNRDREWENEGDGEVRIRNQGRRVPARDRDGSVSGEDVDFSGLGTFLGWTVALLAVVLLVVWLVRLITGGAKDVTRPRQATKAGPTPTAPLVKQVHLTRAQQLAAEGRHDEAIHVLLLETLGALATHIPGTVRRAWTSREILAKAPLQDDAREALGHLVRAVEDSLFGHGTPGAVEFQRCEAAWTRFAEAARRGTLQS